MAEQAILTVSLKEYKAAIDELRASLLSLEETDEQYVKTAEDIARRQAKLNQVMSIGKKNADALDGSYNALVREMGELKKRWKETADAAERADLGKRIFEINEQLKEMDSSVGVFTRNVGNYGSVWEEVAKQGVNGIKGMDGAFGKTAQTVGQLFPLIQKSIKAAITGLNGVKAAVVGTGIGALIVALSTIIANWDTIRTYIFDIEEKQKSLNEVNEEYNKKLEREKEELGYQVDRLKAEGKSQKEILVVQITKIQALLEEAKLRKSNLEMIKAEMVGHSWLRKAFSGEFELIKQADEAIKGFDSSIASLEKELRGLNNALQIINDFGEGGSGGGGGKSAMQNYIQETLDSLKDFGKSELQILEDNYKAERKKLDDYYAKHKKEKENYEKALNLLTQKYAKEREDILKASVDASAAVIDELERKFNPDYSKEAIQKVYDEQKKIIEKALDAELQLFEGTEEEKAKIREKYNNYLTQLDKKRVDDEKSLLDKSVEDAYNAADKKAKQQMDNAVKQANNDYKATTVNGVINPEETIKKLDRVFEAQKTYYEQVIKQNQEISANNQLTENEREAAAQRATQAILTLKDLELQHTIDVNKAKTKDEKKSWKDIVQVSMQGAQALGSIMNQIAGLWQADIDRKVENGEISEEQAKAEFERVKNLQYATTVIDTASAAMGAYDSLASIPYVGPALGAAAAAAAIAAGAMQLQQIASTEYDGGGSNAGAGAAPIVVPPITPYTAEPTTNVTGQSDIDKLNDALSNQQIIVKVSDIDAAQNKRKATVNESSW